MGFIQTAHSKIVNVLQGIFSPSPSPSPSNSGVYHERIASEDDDCYIYVPDSNISLGPQLLVVGSQGDSLNTGMRWLNVDIPKDAVISTAYITFMSADNTPQTGTIIQADSAYIPATFTTYEDFIARVFGAESVPFLILECGDGVSYDTPELKTIIQEIIDGVGWESGNPIALFLSDDGTSVYSQANIRDFSLTGQSPLLHIEYLAPVPSPEPSPVTINVYETHKVANLLIPALSVEVEAITPLKDDKAINNQELIDNWLQRFTIKIHTGYRLGIHDTAGSRAIVDLVIRQLRVSTNLADGYRMFDVAGVAFDVEHRESGTTGAEILVDVHKVEYYNQTL
jgi:hypothetical protein